MSPWRVGWCHSITKYRHCVEGMAGSLTAGSQYHKALYTARGARLGHTCRQSLSQMPARGALQVDKEHWPRDHRSQKTPAPHCQNIMWFTHLQERNAKKEGTTAKEAEQFRWCYLNQSFDRNLTLNGLNWRDHFNQKRPKCRLAFLIFSPFLLFLSLLFFPQLFVKPPQTTTLPPCISFSLGWFWSLPPVQCDEPQFFR